MFPEMMSCVLLKQNFAQTAKQTADYKQKLITGYQKTIH